ncbi:hypothetical protein [Ferrimonas balearica]|uniref:hypothetical protein n=1 Tax=Ferrimonas balearica TaxID=44012 RepID=UPI001C990D0D|nr:hypothetical protein [Ferrimonas balearica]MBY5994077.1 hypothetical protein [Ferrimonas balearica]
MQRLLEQGFGAGNVYLVSDTAGETGEQLISLPRFVASAGLSVAIDRLGWRCGDHCFYAVLDRVDDADYYWLIENDVYLDDEALGKLRLESAARSEDLLIHGFAPGASGKTWNKHYRHYYDEPAYGGLFPVVRLSRKAVAYLASERAQLAQRFTGTRYYPNDEVFVCSRLQNNGFHCGALGVTTEGHFNLTRKLVRNVAPGRLHHPVSHCPKAMVAKDKHRLRKNFYRLRWARVYRFLHASYRENNGDRRLLARYLRALFFLG